MPTGIISTCTHQLKSNDAAMKILHFTLWIVCVILMVQNPVTSRTPGGKSSPEPPGRTYRTERVGPSQVVQLYADGFEKLSKREKIFAYYLYLAAIAGRDISIDQHHPDALEVRDLLEGIYTHPGGIDQRVLASITEYLKLFWENNGFYDNLTSKKFVAGCTFPEFSAAAALAVKNGAKFTVNKGPLRAKLERLRGIMFDPDVDGMETNKTPGEDWIRNSAVNYYDRTLTLAEIDAWAKAGREHYPLNSRVVKENGKIVEKTWRTGNKSIPPGLYTKDLAAVNKYLRKAIPYSSSDYQAQTLRLLIKYFETGDPDDYRAFNIHWVKDSSTVDFILGFTEVYLDPRGQKAEYEASIFFSDPEQTKIMHDLAGNAQYFEDRAPWADEFKKKIDRSPIANVINVIVETGGDGPVSPTGINLPNEQAIREQYGSKSVLLHNVVEAYDKSTGKDLLKEFAANQEEIDNQESYGSRADNLLTAMHEVIGHGSGKASPKLGGKDPGDFLPGYYNTLEEARADLMALWNAWDPKLVEIGIAKDSAEARKIGETMFQQSIRVALTQLRRIGSSDQIEEDHMKDRALILHYIMQDSGAVRVEHRDGKTFYRIIDFDRARAMAGKLLAELMRIKAEGDLPAAKALIDSYGLKVDTKLRDEVQERVRRLDSPSYTAFIQPRLVPVGKGTITDVNVEYPLDLAGQMLEYSSFTKKEKAAHY